MIIRLLLFFIVLQGFSQQQNYSTLLIDSELKKDANSVLRFESTTVNVSDPKKAITTTKRVITVLNKKGINDVNAYARYDNNSRVKSLKAEILDAFGNEIDKFKKNDFTDASSVDRGTLYSDSRILFLDYTPKKYPYTVILEKEEVSSTTAFLPSWSILEGFYSSTENSTYTINFNESNPIKYKLFNIDESLVDIKKTSTQLQFSISDFPAISYEAFSPSYLKTIPYVRFFLDEFYLEGVEGYAKTWSDFGTWMDNDLIKESNDLSEENIQEIKNLTANATTNEEKARIVYEYVQNKVRYISVQIEIGGWKPMLASEVDQLGYGDCKALTNYTKNLMETVGIPANYTIVYAGNDRNDIDEEFIAMQGNHAILALELDDTELTWLECTSQDMPFGYIGDFTDDRQVMMIKDNKGVITKTKAYSLEENLEHIIAELDINIDGTIEGKVQQTSKGVFYGDRFRIDTEEKTKQIENLLSDWNHIRGIDIQDFETSNDKEKIEYVENASVVVKDYLWKSGDSYVIKPNLFEDISDENPTRYEKRTHPFEILRTTQNLEELTFKIPSGYTIKDLPENFSLKNEFAQYNVTYQLTDNNTLKFKRHIIFNKGVYDASVYSKYRKFYKSVIKNDNKKLLIEIKN